MEEKIGQVSEVSKFNSGMLLIASLDFLWKQAQSNRRNNRFYDWSLELDSIWSELAGDLKDKDFDKFQKVYDKTEKEIQNIGSFKDNLDGFKKPSNGNIKDRNLHYDLLVKKEIFLRRIEKKLGKGSKMKDPEEDDM